MSDAPTGHHGCCEYGDFQNNAALSCLYSLRMKASLLTNVTKSSSNFSNEIVFAVFWPAALQQFTQYSPKLPVDKACWGIALYQMHVLLHSTLSCFWRGSSRRNVASDCQTLIATATLVPQSDPYLQVLGEGTRKRNIAKCQTFTAGHHESAQQRHLVSHKHNLSASAG